MSSLRKRSYHCTHRQCANERIRIFAILDERVDGHDGKIGLTLGIVHQVEVDELLQLQIVRLHAVDNVGKESAVIMLNVGRTSEAHLLPDILAYCHARDDLLHSLTLLLLLLAVQLGLQLEDLTLLRRRKVLRVAHFDTSLDCSLHYRRVIFAIDLQQALKQSTRRLLGVS